MNKQHLIGLAIGTLATGAGVVLHSLLNRYEPIEAHAPVTATNVIQWQVERVNPDWQLIAPEGTPSMAVPLYGSFLGYYMPVSADQLQVGQIAVFRHRAHAHPLFHQIIDMREDAILTKGSYNHRDDGWVPKSDVLGVVTMVILTEK